MTRRRIVLMRFAMACLISASITITGLVGYYWLALGDEMCIQNCMHKLRNAVEYANTRILDAILVPDTQERITEIDRRFISRGDADAVYARMDAITFDNPQVEHIYKGMKANRVPYRTAQNVVVFKIITDPHDPSILPAWRTYQEYKTRYEDSISRIQEMVAADVYHKYQTMMAVFGGCLLLILITANYAMNEYLKVSRRNRRRCSICKDPLPGKIALSARQIVGDEIRIGRVCCECFDAMFPTRDSHVDLQHYRVLSPDDPEFQKWKVE